jgi:hypothetical protein
MDFYHFSPYTPTLYGLESLHLPPSPIVEIIEYVFALSRRMGSDDLSGKGRSSRLLFVLPTPRRHSGSGTRGPRCRFRRAHCPLTVGGGGRWAVVSHPVASPAPSHFITYMCGWAPTAPPFPPPLPGGVHFPLPCPCTIAGQWRGRGGDHCSTYPPPPLTTRSRGGSEGGIRLLQPAPATVRTPSQRAHSSIPSVRPSTQSVGLIRHCR